MWVPVLIFIKLKKTDCGHRKNDTERKEITVISHCISSKISWCPPFLVSIELRYHTSAKTKQKQHQWRIVSTAIAIRFSVNLQIKLKRHLSMGIYFMHLHQWMRAKFYFMIQKETAILFNLDELKNKQNIQTRIEQLYIYTIW